MLKNVANPDAEIMLGVDIDSKMEDEVRVTVIATGFDGDSAKSGRENPRADVSNGINQRTTSSNVLPGRPMIDPKRFEYGEEEEPELPTFVKKSPKRIQMDD